MPISIKNENQDLLGDLLKQPQETQRGYDPYQWQDAENGRAKNRVLLHQSDGDIKELIEPQPPVSTLIAEIPATVEGGKRAVEEHIENSPELKPFVNEFLAEAGQVFKSDPNVSPINCFRTAEERVRKAHGLPLEREAPLAAPAKVPTVQDDVKRLEAEARKVRTEVGPDYESTRLAILEMTPVPKRRK